MTSPTNNLQIKQKLPRTHRSLADCTNLLVEGDLGLNVLMHGHRKVVARVLSTEYRHRNGKRVNAKPTKTQSDTVRHGELTS